MIEIDGTTGIGGGQILRTAIALSAIKNEPIQVRNIRVDRNPPGLSAQHLAAVRSVGSVCGAEIDGASLRSTEITFAPGTSPNAGSYEIDVSDFIQGKSAGSVTLLFQTLLLPLAFAEGQSQLTLSGGTHVEWSPPFSYVEDVYLPALEPTGVRADVQLQQWGFYPEGGGMIDATVEGHEAGWTPDPLRITERGELYTVDAYSAVANLPEHILQRQYHQVEILLEQEGIPVRLKKITPDAPGRGTAVYLCANYENASAGFVGYGRIGRPAEEVAERAVQSFLSYHRTGEPVQHHLADQLLLPLSLASGRSEYRTDQVTGHLHTNAEVIRTMTDRTIRIEGKQDESGRVIIE